MVPSKTPTFVTLCLFPLAVSAVEPKQASWSSQAYGPDGPWNAVDVSIGDQPELALFPGRMWNTFVTASDYCALNGSIPHCASGSYKKDRAAALANTPERRILFKQPGQELMAGVVVHGVSNMYLDSADMLFEGGTVGNHSLALIESQMFEYPDGTWYPIWTGCLSVGAPDRLHTFHGQDGRPSVNGSMIPWALKDQGLTPSSSFGLHYGSAVSAARMSGSLLYGGYDRNRVVGKVLSFDGDLWRAVTLQDISIRVVKGHSPFEPLPSGSDAGSNTSMITGLLTKGNSSISSAGLPVLLDPCSPYLTLPQSTCDNIASYLPVSYDSSLGLYKWDVSSPRYNRTVVSASALSFTIMGATNTESLTIHVPLRHLNLTLGAPFADPPVPYFPCFTGGPGAYVLGRAFFQDAFLGANWERRKVWLAQAPGPNVPAGVDAVGVQPDQDQIDGGANDWERSWDGFWTVLTAEEANGTEPVDVDDGARPGGGTAITGGSAPSSSSASSPGEGSTNTGLSTGAIAGIAVGAAVGAMAVVAAGVLFWCRGKRKAGKTLAAMAAAEVQPHYGSYQGDVKEPGWGAGLTEAPETDSRIYEMPGEHASWGQQGWGQAR